jgi:hypothetical protein
MSCINNKQLKTLKWFTSNNKKTGLVSVRILEDTEYKQYFIVTVANL